MIRTERKNDSDRYGFLYDNYDGPERRNGLDRRTGLDRRGAIGFGQLSLPLFQKQYDLGLE